MRGEDVSAMTRWLLVGVAATALLGHARAAEVYTWTDADGVVHFSDSPPISGESRRIEAEQADRPGTAKSVDTPVGPQADPAPAVDQVGETKPPGPAEARREAIRQRGAERRERREESERLCALHRQRLEQMEPARRVFYRNEAGEEVRMDDEQRIALVEEDRAYLAANCR